MPPTVEKMGVAVRIFPLVQFGKIWKSVGECMENEGMQVTRLPKILS